MNAVEYLNAHPHPENLIRRKPNGSGVVQAEPMYLLTLRSALHEVMEPSFGEISSDAPRYKAFYYLHTAFEIMRPNTAFHNKHVKDIALAIANAYNSSPEGTRKPISTRNLDTLEKAALIHDIGKIGIPLFILRSSRNQILAEQNKFGDLHPYFSFYLISYFRSLNAVAETVLLHHENCDGSGPVGFTEKDLPLIAQILRIADIYHAGISDRPGNPAENPQSVIRYLKNECRLKVNQGLVALLERLLK